MQYKSQPKCLNISRCTSKLQHFFKRLLIQVRRMRQTHNRTRHWKTSLHVSMIIATNFNCLNQNRTNKAGMPTMTYLIMETSKEGSSTRKALSLHLGSLAWILSASKPIHLWIPWPTKEEVMTQATGIALWDESKTSKVHRGYCKEKPNKKWNFQQVVAFNRNQ